MQEYFCKVGSSLQELRLSNTGLSYLPGGAFDCLKDLSYLDITDVSFHIEIDKYGFSGLKNIQNILVNDYMICCMFKAAIPIRDSDCLTKKEKDELSSCSNLLKTDFLRFVLWAFAISTLIGNTGVLAYR